MSESIGDKVEPNVRVELGADIAKDLLVMVAEPAASNGSVQGSAQALATDLDEMPAGEARELADELVEERAEQYAKLQNRVLKAVAGNDALELKVQYTNIPFLLMNVQSLAGLEALAALPEVVHVYENTVFEHQLAQSLAQIKQPEAAAQGKLGANTAVAVLDTGCDYTRSAFGSCSSAGAPGCKVAYAQDFATQDNALDADGHGTNVSGIVLGVAPSTKIVALDVFNGGGAPGSVILQAIDWVISNRTTYNIVAINMSLGSGSYNAPCSSDYFATAVANARSAGILSAIASGNNGYTSSIATPACVPAAISVGAVYDANVGGLRYGNCTDATTAADKVTCFSNSASFLSVLAPGAPITAAGITMHGTSQATPHVAGAIAVMRSAFPNESVAATATRITDTGTQIRDTRNNITKRRLDLQAALGAAAPDTTAPTGSVDIEAGATATNKTNVTLTITGSDNVAVTQMCVSSTTSCTAYSTFATTKAWSLPSGDGVKTVYLSLRDAAGNVTRVTDTIVRDATLPTNPVLTATANDGRVDLSWTAGSDASSGVSSYKVVYTTGSAPATCNTGTVVYNGSARTASQNGVNGTLYYFRVCAIDAAGNMSAGATASARPVPESNAPTGTVVIQGGAQYAKSTGVTLTIAATDDTAVTTMCISNTSASCSSYIAYTTSKTWSITSAGTVFVWFRDAWGNTSTTPASDTILVDSTMPTMGSTFNATPSTGRVTLSWTSASDSGSGLNGYRVVWAKSTSAPTCALGNLAYEGTGNAYPHEGLTAGTYSYRLCASDRAGNTSTGLTRTVTVR